MARFRPRSGFRSSKPLHPVRWCALADFTENVPAGNSAIGTICGADDFEQFTNPTVVRIRGIWQATLERVAADASEAIRVAVGIRTVPEDFLLANLEDMLSNNGAESPWMWYGHFRLSSTLEQQALWDSDTNTIVNTSRSRFAGGLSSHHWDIDVKAMRRVPQNTKLIWAYTSDNAVGEPNLTTSISLRVLVKE